MKVISSVSEMQKWAMEQKCAGRKVGVVPTMGFLHEGHLSLVDKVREAGAASVVLTIFVNPTQFGPNEDFDKYPRDLERDLSLCRSKNVDAVFTPAVKDMYPEAISCWVVEEKLSRGLCAVTRPTHFKGVTTVVAKLFNATLPDIAVFGQKDAQQALILKRMVRDLNFPITIVVAPIVREKDGLALSSRNKYLSDDDRARALSISKSLAEVKVKVESGSVRDALKLTDLVKNNITQVGGRVDYVEAVDAENLEPVSGMISGDTLFAVAAYFGKTRLIDNMIVKIK